MRQGPVYLKNKRNISKNSWKINVKRQKILKNLEFQKSQEKDLKILKIKINLERLEHWLMFIIICDSEKSLLNLDQNVMVMLSFCSDHFPANTSLCRHGEIIKNTVHFSSLSLSHRTFVLQNYFLATGNTLLCLIMK